MTGASVSIYFPDTDLLDWIDETRKRSSRSNFIMNLIEQEHQNKDGGTTSIEYFTQEINKVNKTIDSLKKKREELENQLNLLLEDSIRKAKEKEMDEKKQIDEKKKTEKSEIEYIKKEISDLNGIDKIIEQFDLLDKVDDKWIIEKCLELHDLNSKKIIGFSSLKKFLEEGLYDSN